MKTLISRLILLFALIPAVSGCSSGSHDERLDKVAHIVSESPEEALSCLDGINPNKLDKKDIGFYNFLTIKARDKAYIRHTSDSLFLKTLGYYTDHPDNLLYPEILYYGGRVYSDLGDYPTALRYFKSALDALPDKTTNLDLRGNILSQLGRLHDSMRLYREAVPYVEEAIEIDERLGDTINTVYDLQLLGSICIRSKEYGAANGYLQASLAKCHNLPQSFRAKTKVLLAGMKFKMGQIDSALILIRNTPDEVKPTSRNTALAYASNIYLAAGINDTAFIYARELIRESGFKNKQTGYQNLLSPELRDMSHPDTVFKYISDYRRILESVFNENESRLFVTQQAFYNYQLHERDRIKAEKTNHNLRNWISGICIVSMFLCIVILYLRIRSKNILLRLHTALDNIDALKARLKLSETSGLTEDISQHGSKSNPGAESVTVLRERLRDKLLELANDDNIQPTISPEILTSEAYQTLQSYISQGRIISEKSDLWNLLESVVLNCSPEFKTNLQLLTDGKLTRHDFYTALLIKCGTTPSQMALLLGRSKGAISSRRESLCFKIFDKKLGTKIADRAIRLL